VKNISALKEINLIKTQAPITPLHQTIQNLNFNTSKPMMFAPAVKIWVRDSSLPRSRAGSTTYPYFLKYAFT
ncbi:hypothetical protein AKJ40_03790, partial [candidate division MSBL1 archaeon SCGC-AAA259M10]